MSALFRYAIASSAKSLAAYSVACVVVMSVYFSVYQTYADSTAMTEMLSQMPGGFLDAFGFNDISSGAGWAQSTFFGLIGMVLLMAFGITRGAAFIAGDEESGMLELALARSVSRAQVYAGRGLALLVLLAILTAVSGASLAVWNSTADMAIDPVNVLPQLLAFLGLGGACGVTAYAAGAFTGKRSTANGAGAGVAVGAFLLNAVGSMGDEWEWMHWFSPMAWAYKNRPLANGWDVPGLAALAAFAIAVGIAGWLAFKNRDVA